MPSQLKEVHNSPNFLPVNFQMLNEWLVSHCEEELDFVKLKKVKNYKFEQLSKFKRILDASVNESGDCDILTWYQKSQYFDEMITSLQDYVKSSAKNSEKLCALTVLPSSWSARQVTENFCVSSRMAKKAKTLVAERGVLSSPNKKGGKKIANETLEAVKSFYYQQDVTKELAGVSNMISVREENGERTKKPKRLVLANLRHLYDEFCERNEHVKVSFSKFAALRPRECVLAGSSGMHNVCVCTIHQNPKLMFDAANLKTLADVGSVTECLKLLLCADPTVDCHLGDCEKCPGSTNLREKLEVAFDAEMIDSVTFNQWESADRCNIFTKTGSTDFFIDEFVVKLEALVPHHFIFKKQVAYFNELRENLKENEIIVIGDFAENFSFIVQDSAQGFYFSNRQSTIHPCSIYYRDPESLESKQASFAVISNCMDHSTVAVYAFQKKLIPALKTIVPGCNKIFYFSDGAAAQYKNKSNIANVWFHEKDFNISAEWHYFATSHGKTACDGIGGTIKRLASLFSLKHTEPGTQITTPERLFEWAESNIKNVNFLWVSSDDVAKEENFLEVRFRLANPIVGIRSNHAVLPCSNENFVTLKRYSDAVTGAKHEISTVEIGVKFEDVKGFVTIWSRDSSSWELAYVEEKYKETNTFLLQKLVKKQEKKYDYVFTSKKATMHSLESILTLTQPAIAAKGRIVRIHASEAAAADTLLERKLKPFL